MKRNPNEVHSTTIRRKIEMFCHKCGAQMVEGAAFCPKCGTKAVHTDDNQQPMNTATPIVEPQQADAEVPPIAENTKRTPKASGLRKVAIIGRVLMWGGVATTVLASSH
jgi:uncharacterized membrane protein YvbJ